MTDSNIIGRDREIAQLDLSVGPGTDGLRFALLSGPSGLGKTTLSTRAIERARERGFRVATVNGRAGTLSTPFAPFIEAMPEFDALLTVLASDGASVDIEHAGIFLVKLLSDITVDQPLLLCFDDVQALDESSIALLPYLVGVSERMNLTLLFVEQTDATGVPASYRAFIDGLLARRVVSRLELGPMADDAVTQLVAHELGLEELDAVPAEIVLRAQGNPWFAKELAAAWRSGVSTIPTTIAAAATARLHGLETIGQDLVFATSLCDDGAHISWLEALSGQTPRAFVRTMEAIVASGLVREHGDVVSIAHPLMQQALTDELSSAMRRAIHLELAEIIASTELPEVQAARARGYHLAAAGRSADAVAEHLRAAGANEIAGQLHEAYADLRRALDTEPSIEARVDLLRRCAGMAMQLGIADAVALWTELGRLASATHDDELYAYALFQQYWASNDGTANERLQRAAALGEDRLGWSARAAATMARMDGDYERAMAHDRRAIELAQANGDGTLEALALEKLASSLADVGRTGESIETFKTAIQRAISIRLHDWAAVSWGCLVITQLDELQTGEALREAHSVEQYVSDVGIDRMLPAILAWKSNVLMRRGDLEAALETIERGVDLDRAFSADPQYRQDHFGALVHLIRAQVANEIGAGDAVERAATATAMLTELGYASWLVEATFESARALARRDGLDRALPLLDRVEDSGEPTFIADVALWLARAAVMSAHDGAMERARALAVAAQGETPPSPRAQLAIDELQTILAVVDGAPVTDLDAIALRWTDADRALDALRVSAVTGALAANAGTRDVAKTYLQHARSGLAACGASYDADQVAAMLRALGTRSRAKSRTTNVGPLTKRELEIARLVASGLRNSEVAGSLFLAEKTVAAHLSNIYGKVEVRSRVQLTAWIRENDAEFEATLVTAAS